MMLSRDVRESFLAFFERNGHSRVASSGLVPAEDPTLLFTNAGMVQFKSVFTGDEKRDYARATSAQRCVRAGGKHNDLENVGFTARHHTFFEMMGNFSFGDYFKEGAVDFAYRLLINEWKLDPKRMVYTVFEGAEGIPADDEARALWRRIAGVADDRVVGLGMKDNFWAMGDTGPCGPCSEIIYHQGDDAPCGREVAGGKCAGPACDCDRWMEIWNLVFMQYERKSDGAMIPLPKPSIDTGLGLERAAAVLQEKRSNYDTDLFQSLIMESADAVGVSAAGDEKTKVSLRVIADHIRASSFLIADGVYPSNEGRGYVLRRIMRRMIRHARMLGVNEPRLFPLVGVVDRLMGDAHPIIRERRRIVTDAVKREEEAFLQTLDRGMGLLDEAIASLPAGERRIPGLVVFKLYDTFGFPPDLTEIIATEKNVILDMAEFEREMKTQRDRSRAASRFGLPRFEGLLAEYRDISDPVENPTDYIGYDCLEISATILLLESLGRDEQYAIALEKTPFYAESGGQVGDCGKIISGGSVFFVENTGKTNRGIYLHYGKIISGSLESFSVGTPVLASVDRATRLATERNHTATHLLHAALFEVLGDHVQQAGSYVGPDRLRFDFNHPKAMASAELERVERIINAAVAEDYEVTKRVLPATEARQLGAKAFFGDKYGELVRVVSVENPCAYRDTTGESPFSREFCGGTHVRRTGEIGFVKIVSESAIASGVRRIEAVTGAGAVEWTARLGAQVADTCRALSTSPESLVERVKRLMDERKALEKELAKSKLSILIERGAELASNAKEIAGAKVIALLVEDADAETLRAASADFVKRLGSGIVALAATPRDEDGGRKAAFCVQVSPDLVKRAKAGEIVNRLAAICGGKGGGRPEVAQAGGKDGARAAEAIQSAGSIIAELLSAGVKV